MSVSNVEKEFVSYLVELMQPIGSIYAKRMFGAYGLFQDGLMFAIVSDKILYLKADKSTEQVFKEKGLPQLTYLKQGKACQLSYFQAPEETLEDPDEMHAWTSQAYQVALSAASKKQLK